MTSERAQYLAYLLRLWQARSGQEYLWRVSLEDAHTGQRHGFAGLEELLAFLREQTDPGKSTPSDRNSTRKGMSL